MPDLIDINNPEAAAGNVAVTVQEPVRMTAQAALGLDEPVSVSLERGVSSLKRFLPPETAGLPDPPKPEEPPKPADPAPPADPPKADEPALPEPPDKPAEPAATPKADEPAPPAKAVDPGKVTVDGREYTHAELAAIVAKANSPQPAQEPPKPPKAETPKPPEPTKEEIAAREAEFVSKVMDNVNVAGAFTKDDVETLLVGGEEALPVVEKLLRTSIGRAVLEARRSIYDEINPIFEQLSGQVTPIAEQTRQLERYTTTQLFNERHPEFTEFGHLETATAVAEQLIQMFPEKVANMTREQFVDEVARQTDGIVQQDFKRFHPKAEGSWKEHFKAAQNPPAPETPPGAETPAAPAEPAKPAEPPKPKPKPPAAASPSLVGGKEASWHKKTAASLI